MLGTPKKIKLSLAALIIIVLIFIFHLIGIIRPIENVVLAAIRPFQHGVYGLSQSIRRTYDEWRVDYDLKTRVRELEDQNLNNLAKVSEFELLKEEVDFLRGQLDLAGNNGWELQVAAVIGASQDDNTQTVIIDRGAKSQIEKDMPVIINNGVIVGKVVEVFDYTAIVRLLNDHASQVAATVRNQDGTVGVVQGEFGLGVKMDLIPENEEVAIGDLVITSGLEEKVPRGLVIGLIENVFGSDEDIFKTATVKLPIDFTKLNMISVIIKR